MLGIGFAQALPLLFTPLLTRLFSENDFAVYTSFFAVGSVFAVGAGARYQYAIMLPKRNGEAVKIFSLSIYLTVIYAFLLFLFLLIFRNIDFQLGNAVFLVPIFVLLFGVWNAFSNLSIRYKTFKQNSFAKVLQSIFYIITGIALGLLKLTFLGLVFAKMIGVSASMLFLFKKSVAKFRTTKLEDLKIVAKKYIDYPKYGFLPAFMNTASGQAMVIILMNFYPQSELGYFGLTFMILSAPISLIGASFKEVFYQKITFLLNRNEYNKSRSLFNKSAIGLLIIGTPFCLILFFFGSDIFSFAFGNQWERSGEFASILSFAFLIQLVVSPLSSIFNAANKLKIASYYQILNFITTFITLGVSAYFLKLEIEQLLYVFLVHELILYSIYFIMQFKTMKSLS